MQISEFFSLSYVVEVHAELCYAECLLQRALLTFVQDENLVSFIKGGLKIRSCYQSYKECLQILRSRNWTDKTSKKHFESGVNMGVGAFNLLISCLPSRILKLLEFIGFSGSRKLGLSELDKGYRLKPGLRGPLCATILLAYHTVVTYFIGSCDGDLDYAAEILSSLLQAYPQGVLCLFYAGRLEEIKGNMDQAIFWLEKAINVQEEFKQFQHLCYWELMWCHCYKCDWQRAAHFADLLKEESHWSKTTYCYQKASFMCMMMDELTEEEKLKLKMLMNDLPKYKQRIAGKSLPMEKFAIKKAQRFQQRGGKLIIPALELIYLWNGFSIICKKLELIDQIFGLLERTARLLEADKNSNLYYVDEYCLVQLLRGMCLKHMSSPLQAEECFKEVWQSEKKLKDDFYLAPFALVELGLLYLQTDNLTEAEHCFTNARNYKGYSVESRLHFKIHSGLAQLKAKRKVTTSSTNSNATNSVTSSADSDDRLTNNGNSNGNSNGVIKTNIR